MKISKKIAAFAVTAALTVGGLGVAQSATAAQIPSGSITVTPAAGNISDQYLFQSITASAAAPANFRAASGTFAYQNGVEMGSLAQMRQPGLLAEYGTTGLDGATPAHHDRVVAEQNNYVSNKQLSALSTPLQTGAWELRLYYFASSTSPNRATDPYVKLDMTYDAATGAWAVYTAATATTTSLTASAAGSAVTLTATVKNGAATATNATGNVVFKEGATTVGTIAVANGVAATTLAAVANGAHSYTAEFQPTGTTYAASTSGAASVHVGAQQDDTDVVVTIPNNIGALTLSGTSASVDLGTAVLTGNTLNASGTLSTTVTDTRQLGNAGWSLTGQVGDFADGAKVLEGKYLGWTPVVAATTTAAGSVAGAVVAAAGSTGSGLKTSSVLATGAPNETGPVTNVTALLELKAPRTTAAGSYSATLTVTLV